MKFALAIVATAQEAATLKVFGGCGDFYLLQLATELQQSQSQLYGYSNCKARVGVLYTLTFG